MAGKYLSVRIHFVWSTANREPTISEVWADQLYAYVSGILTNKKAKLLCAGGMPDHVHLLVSMPSTETIADLVGVMKANSSRWIHDTFPDAATFAWQKGYGAFSVSKSAERSVIQYIVNQAEHHRRRDFKSEFIELLEKHGIEYDERYLWE